MTEAVLLVDCHNVRGVAAFTHTTAHFISLLDAWFARSGLSSGRGFCYVDHGSSHSAVVLPSGLTLCFAGPTQTADDDIVDDAAFFSLRCSCPVVVVTNDQLLRRRCVAACEQRGGSKKARAKQRKLVPPPRLVGSAVLLAAVHTQSSAVCPALSRLHTIETWVREWCSHSEVTWMRVVAGECLRRLLSRPDLSATSMSVSSCEDAADNTSDSANSHKDTDETIVVSPDVAGSAMAHARQELAERFLLRRSKGTGPVSWLLRDHRIAAVPKQQQAVRRLVAAASQHSADAIATTEANDNQIEQWLQLVVSGSCDSYFEQLSQALGTSDVAILTTTEYQIKNHGVYTVAQKMSHNHGHSKKKRKR